MGLAFPSLSSYNAKPFFNTLISEGAVDAGQFGFYLASSGSELSLGGSNSSLHNGDISWNAVTEEVCFHSPICAPTSTDYTFTAALVFAGLLANRYGLDER